MIQETHIGLVIVENDRLMGAKYMLSKWERDLGDTLTIDGKKWRVGIIGKNRNAVITAMNEFIRQENAITRRENKIAKSKARAEWLKANKSIADTLEIYSKLYI